MGKEGKRSSSRPYLCVPSRARTSAQTFDTIFCGKEVSLQPFVKSGNQCVTQNGRLRQKYVHTSCPHWKLELGAKYSGFFWRESVRANRGREGASIFHSHQCVAGCPSVRPRPPGWSHRRGREGGRDLIVLLIIGFQVGGPDGEEGGTAVGTANRRWPSRDDGRDDRYVDTAWASERAREGGREGG